MEEIVASISKVAQDVKDYYTDNWTKIANCYDLDSDGIPLDSAWYRRKIYNDYLSLFKPESVIDIGCGGGQTVLDALDLGIEAKGYEPISNLVDFGRNKLADANYDSAFIQLGDASVLESVNESSVDSVALLSVIPHIPIEDWAKLHSQIYKVLKSNGTAIIAYRNELFDLFTANRFTIDFFMNNFFTMNHYSKTYRDKLYAELSLMIPNFDKPNKNFTESKDKRFGELNRPKCNPLTINNYLITFGFKVEGTYFCNFHSKLPLMLSNEQTDKFIKHNLEIDLSDSWQGNFMASMFLVVVRKP